MAGHQAPTMLYEDIYRLIIQQAIDQNQSLQNLACTSRLFATICRGHLFKRVRIDINSQENIHVLNDILDRDAEVERHVRQMTITDVCPPAVVEKPVAFRKTFSPPTYVDGYIQLKDPQSLLSSTLARLGNLHTAELVLTYVYARHLPLRWEDLSPVIQFLIQQPQMRHINFKGIRYLPAEVSMGFLLTESLRLSSCSFAPVQAPAMTATDLYRFRDSKITLSQFSFSSISIDDPTPASEQTTILCHWLSSHHAQKIALPQLSSLALSLRRLSDIEDAGTLLSLFQSQLTQLSLDTSNLHLEALQLTPLYHAAREAKLTPSLSLSQIDVPFLIAQGISTIMPDGWVTCDLVPISLRQLPSLSLRSLDLRCAHWAGAKNPAGESAADGELEWVCNMLSDLPSSRASTIEELSLSIRIGSHGLKDKEFIESITHLADSEHWCALREALMQNKWSGLRNVVVKLDVGMTFFGIQARQFGRAVVDHLRGNMLGGLDVKGWREVTVKLERS